MGEWWFFWGSQLMFQALRQGHNGGDFLMIVNGGSPRCIGFFQSRQKPTSFRFLFGVLVGKVPCLEVVRDLGDS